MSLPRTEICSTRWSPVWPRAELISIPLAPSASVTRSPAAVTVSDILTDAPATSCDKASCALVIAERTRSALPTIASRSFDNWSISERIRRSLSLYERSRLVTSECTSVSSSLARARARSIPSPIEATSRRMAWLSETTCSVASVSGSASRTATWVIARAVRRISCVRRNSAAVTKKNTMGARTAISNSAFSGLSASRLSSGTDRA